MERERFAGGSVWRKHCSRLVMNLMDFAPIRAPLLSLAGSGFLPKPVWEKLWVEREFDVTLPDGNTFSYSTSYGDVIGQALFWGQLKHWEPETIPVFSRLAANAHGVLDIGANTGVYSMIACAVNPASKVMAFEPVPHVRERLIENIRLNGWERQCEVRDEAVTDFVGHTKLLVPFGLVPSFASLDTTGNSDGYVVDVPAITVDKACSEIDRIDLVKIDVEGFEHRVLGGMQHILRKWRPKIILEANPGGPIVEIQRILSPLGYKFYSIREEGLAPSGNITPDPTGICRNVLCVVEE